jgi:hypothetical protein
MKKIIVISVISIVVLSGCSKYGSVNLKYPTPPIAFLPDDIHTIAIVNRSLVRKEDKNNSIIESIVSGKIAGSDRLASDECLKGVFDRINGWHQLSIVIPPKTRLYGTGTRQTPELLNWNIVKNICDTTKADALLVLETFDSNSDILASTVNYEINAVINRTNPIPLPPRQIRVNTLSFWRLYDPSTKKIIDEFESTNFLTFNASGPEFSPPSDALYKTAYASGEQYIERFLPGYCFVKRELYKRGKGSRKQEFKTAFRRAEVADWSGASELWTELTKSSNRRNAGRACLNMAVTCEVLGKTDQAFIWAKKSYEDYANKLGREYANKLKYRISIE